MMRERWLGAAAVFAACVAAAGCSNNEAASRACSAMTDSASCSACCTSNGANGHKIASGSPCGCLGGDGSGKSAPAPAAAAAVSFAGTYKSAWGATVFTQQGNQVSATYPNGTMACVPNGSTLDCNWREAASSGKALLTKDASGGITGTWGTGTSATNGGPWVFTP